MNARQQFVLLAGIGLLSLACLFPPWKFVLNLPGKVHVEKSGTYRLIFSPPKVPITEATLGSPELWYASIDSVRLTTGLGGIIGVTALVVGFVQTQRNDIQG